MKMTLKGRRLEDAALILFGSIERKAEGELIILPASAEHAGLLTEVKAMALVIRPGLTVQPGDPRWFYALPLGLRGTVVWADPDDVSRWKAVAEPMFDLKKPG